MSYLPDHFTDNSWTTIQSFIEHFPLATLISSYNNEIFTSHIPFIVDNNKLLWHINKDNPQFNHLHLSKVELVFHGGDSYISPSAFVTEELPTFNFAKVHIKGQASYVQESNLIKSLVDMTSQLDDQFKLSYEHPKIDKLKHFIQGLEVNIEDVNGRFKMSQDKSNHHFKKAKDLFSKTQKARMNWLLKQLEQK
jgi:transcriptional regulator